MTKDGLRSKAESLLRSLPEAAPNFPAEDVKQLLHELQVYQVELEMQNDELLNAQVELETSRTKYQDLYDFSPAGYFDFDPDGLIHEANLTASRLLGVENRHLKWQQFAAPPPGERGKRKVSREAVEEALRQAGGRKTRAAVILGISRATLYRYLHAYDLVEQKSGDEDLSP